MEASSDHGVEIALKAVNDTANAVSARFIAVLGVTAYVAVTVAATTHEMLLRANNLVTLPLLNAQIPIIGPFGFYTVAPWVIVLLHADLLLQLSILATELGRLESFLTERTQQAREQIHQQLENFYYVLYLTGQTPSRLLHRLSAFITWITAVALPLMILLGIQIRFLPSHSPIDTWLHRGAILVDAALIILVALPRLVPFSTVRLPTAGWRLMLRPMSVRGFTVLACAASVTLSLFVITLPGEYGYAWAWFPRNMQLREHVLTANTIRPEDLEALRDPSLHDLAKLEDVLIRIAPLKAINGRDFRYADLQNAMMPKIDLRALRLDSGAKITPVVLPRDCAQKRGCEDPPDCADALSHPTQLTGAILKYASSQRGMFDQAILDDADLEAAKLQQGSFRQARLNGANLKEANLRNAFLQDSKLCGADMKQAILANAHLEGAFLRGARLENATLTDVNLKCADLHGADLRGADLRDADLHGADLRAADLSGADLSGADLSVADFRGAKLDGAKIDAANTVGAIFEDPGEHSLMALERNPSSTAATRISSLISLACTSAAIARGIARQAIPEEPCPSSTDLAEALLSEREKKGARCAGLHSLSPGMVRELRRALEPRKHCPSGGVAPTNSSAEAISPRQSPPRESRRSGSRRRPPTRCRRVSRPGLSRPGRRS